MNKNDRNIIILSLFFFFVTYCIVFPNTFPVLFSIALGGFLGSLVVDWITEKFGNK